MPRNRYTRVVRKHKDAWLARREEALEALARQLRHEEAKPSDPPLVVEDTKQRRRARLEQNKRHKATPGSGDSSPPPSKPHFDHQATAHPTPKEVTTDEPAA